MQRAWLVASVGVFLVIGVSVIAVPALEQDCPELEGRWPYGPAFFADVSGGYLYYGSGSVLEVAELSSPADPQAVGETAPLPGGVFDVAVSGGYAYVANGSGGLRVIDVSVPSAPDEVGSLETTGVFCGGSRCRAATRMSRRGAEGCE